MNEGNVSAMSSQPLLALPTDIYRLVFGHLDVADILVLRQTCKEFHELSILRSVWDTLLRRHIINQNIPIPGLDGKTLDSLSSSELEGCYRRALALRRNWTSTTPTVRRHINIDNGVPNSRIIAIVPLPERANRRIVSLSMTPGQHRVFTLQCWDVGGIIPVCLATHEMKQFRGMAVNRVACDHGDVAVLTLDLEILSIDSETVNPQQGFVTKTLIPDAQRLHALHLFSKSSFLTRDTNGLVYLWDMNTPYKRWQLQNPNIAQPRPLVDILITDNFIVASWLTTLELYIRPSESAASANNDVFLHPISIFTWPWRIDNAVMTLTHRPGPSQGRTPIDILLRFGSYYPWPLNILHHYEIRPNPDFLTDPGIGMSEHNPPYEFPPILLESIASPVRLHATTDMAIGPYGTAIWTDSHTEDYFNHSDRGQRVASTFSRYIVNDEGEEEVELSDQVATASAATVYAYHEEDSWVRVAMDEIEGRIFLGHDNGLLSVLEYA
ncbi:hypothetical protein BDN70DRAFT_59801 [Pholiota conissans]|uniref:F-box domain-containing protein n=1 Tax=Pholiota conissans TaxID=109636 RepID=A0A9P6CZB2_9AGAR|nr:hypothetical protein BDN70DRAFT_59801 [Pholiota conissans]